MRHRPDLDAFGAVIGSIYECALDPAGWSAALEGIRSAVGGGAAWIAVHYPDQVRSVYQIEVGTDPEWRRRLREHYVAASPFMGVTHHLNAGDVVAVGDVIDYAEFVEGRFYQEWVAPQGWPDIIMAVAAKERDRFSWLGICLTGRATVDQKRMVGALLPHVERSLRISDLLEMRAAQSADLAAAVESPASGMVLVDADLAVRAPIRPRSVWCARPEGFLWKPAGCTCPTAAPGPIWRRRSTPVRSESWTAPAHRSCLSVGTATWGLMVHRWPGRAPRSVTKRSLRCS